MSTLAYFREVSAFSYNRQSTMVISSLFMTKNILDNYCYLQGCHTLKEFSNYRKSQGNLEF